MTLINATTSCASSPYRRHRCFHPRPQLRLQHTAPKARVERNQGRGEGPTAHGRRGDHLSLRSGGILLAPHVVLAARLLAAPLLAAFHALSACMRAVSQAWSRSARSRAISFLVPIRHRACHHPPPRQGTTDDGPGRPRASTRRLPTASSQDTSSNVTVRARHLDADAGSARTTTRRKPSGELLTPPSQQVRHVRG